MGKLKRGRQKLHHVSKHSPKAKNADSGGTMETDTVKPAGISEFPSKGLFSGLDIDLPDPRQLLDDDNMDAKSSVTSRSFKGLGLKKKDKQKIRHELWMKKMDMVQAAKKEAKEKRKREKTAVVGDMKPLEDTLPTLELLLRDTHQHQHTRQKREQKPKGIKKEKTRKKDMMKDMMLFQQVVKHPAFKANPKATISEHLANTMTEEDAAT